jgi:hypothetical protein
VFFRCLGLALLLSGAFTLPAIARDDPRVKAFQDAIAALKQKPKGTCQGIPYSDLRDECERKGNEVIKWCKSTPASPGPRACDPAMDP